ncbi:ATP-binding protein [Nocardiopsis sp. RSe5-2]|uniref:histidine kinase n=1 Tax=Nocardiopsis endophytica TaxID=3018445 RepID=A0ABT4U7N6_9ACTN|nr:ATP-binding protein [Nocardiopsis endophytica]MDA2812965.1 ATP-binding protein [Nocardiopsis endophytica]
MSEFPPTVAGVPGEPPALGEDPDADLSGIRSVHVWISLLPALLVAAVAAVAVAALLTASPTDMTAAVVLIAAGACAALVLAGAVLLAERATTRVQRAAEALRRRSERTRGALMQLSARVERGEDVRPVAESGLPSGGDAFALLAHEQRAALTAAWNTAVRAHRAHLARQGGVEATAPAAPPAPERPAAPSPAPPAVRAEAAPEAQGHRAPAAPGAPAPNLGTGQQVEVFVNVARRMQSLVHRQIGLLDELEAQVEDPDLLKGLFTIDHLATRMRRQSESLAVLGGASSRRRWSRPVNLYEVLRSAVAEVEDYSRVKVVPPSGGTLAGGAVVDVIHLIAELVENATKFSPPRTRVLLRTEEVGAGIAVEVEDRGLGVPPEERRRMNELLAEPDRVDIGELLRDGRIGLFVVAALARKHGARVQLQTSVYGGTLAVVVLPSALLGTAEERPRRRPVQEAAEPAAPARAPEGAAAGRSATGGRRAAEVPAAARSTSPREAVAVQDPTDPVPPNPSPSPGPEPAPAPMPSARSSVVASAFERAGVARPAPPPPPSGNAVGPGERPAPAPGAPEPAPAAPSAPAAPPDNAERPPLPERQVQESHAPELRRSAEGAPGDAAAPGAAAAGAPGDDVPTLGLMAAYQGGFRRAEQEGGDGTPAS